MRLRILAVNDEPETLNVFTQTVGALGYEVIALADSLEAARRIASEKFDLIALDSQMQKLDGFELARRVRTSPSNQGVPILLLTTQDAGEAVRRGFALGVTFYLEKPLNAEKLRGLFSAARGMIFQQRRRYVRLPVAVPVECTAEGRQFQTRSVDLAQGGILLETSGGLSEGETLQLKFSLPGIREALNLAGRVARKTSEGGLAVEFVEPQQMEGAALQLFVADTTSK